MKAPPPISPAAPGIPDSRPRNAAALFGLWLAVVVVKFGNPVIFSELLGTPGDAYEFLLASWPVAWSYAALGLVVIAAGLVGCWKMPGPKWLFCLPLVWLGWQLLSATQTVDANLTRLTVLHFAGCAVCFYAGLCGLSEVRDLRPVWWGLTAGLVVVLWTALDQHFGGLERTRAMFDQLPAGLRARLDTPEFRLKMSSTRVFGTFVYPNALAGGILLLLPAALAGIAGPVRQRGLRWVVVALLTAAALAVLYWSGSKSGWLIALALGGMALWRMERRPPARRELGVSRAEPELGAPHRPIPVLKLSLLAALLVVGGLAFFGRHAGYFEKGATSLSARRDYWRAAGQMIAARPLLGYGPGTFQQQYKVLKSPDAEMARLTHNDYLQQGCDAGLPAMVAYGVFIAGSLVWLWPRARSAGLRTGASTSATPVPGRRPALLHGQQFAVWLGLLGFAVQSGTEFGLYIPALAWPFFLFLGWLWGTRAGGDRESQ